MNLNEKQKKQLKDLLGYGFDAIVGDIPEDEEEEYRVIIGIVEKELK